MARDLAPMDFLPAIEVDNFSTLAAEDFSAIARLEEAVIPWHNNGHGTPARPVRSRAETYPLFAAETLLRGSARTRPQGAGESGAAAIDPALLAAEFARQGRQILRWAKKRRRLIAGSLQERLVNVGGVEHDVFHDEETGRWLKLTMPGRGGKELAVRQATFGVRPTLETRDALPSSYLRRLVLANRRLGDDFWLHGVIEHRDGPRLVVSQRLVVGEPADPEEIALHFGERGFRPINAKTFYHPGENLLISDAHTANVFRTPEGMAPFDVCVQQPRGALRRAVEPSPTLDFDDWGGEQDMLTF